MTVETVDHVVVGGGASGMTAALLLAMNGRSVVLVEKAPTLGGSLKRFRCGGLPFDSGFHFTGGLEPGGLLDQMLHVLNLRDGIQPQFIKEHHGNEFIIENGGTYTLPTGIDAVSQRLRDYFPTEASAIDRYFKWVNAICAGTPTMNLRNIDASMAPLDEDFMTLQAALDQLTANPELQALLSGLCMCYGASPVEVSMAAHARMCQAIYQSVARVKDGGDAFVRAFEKGLAHHGVSVKCRATITGFEDIHDRKAGRMQLSNGDVIAFQTAIFTLHPSQILDLLPDAVLQPSFRHRVADFEPSSGFFAVFGRVHAPGAPLNPRIVSLFPTADINRLLHPTLDDESALLILQSDEEHKGSTVRTGTILEPVDVTRIQHWSNSKVGHRDPAYYAFKEAKAARMVERANRRLQADGAVFEPIAAATSLTFRDYLHSPDGSAYGIRQKVGQIQVFGKLPLRNVYAAGQSALLPGVLGAMMSSFIIVRAILEKDRYARFIAERLSA